MTERISAAAAAHVAKLARLQLAPSELAQVTSQLDAMLDHFHDIDALDLDGIEPMTQPYPLVNVLRDDVVGPVLDRVEVLAEAPSAVDHRFGVPPIPGEAP